jgi:ribosomal protein L11 methyltransferase
MNYIELNIKVKPRFPMADILISELGESGFESFVDTEDGFLAYIAESAWSSAVLRPLNDYRKEADQLEWTERRIANENWNANWESSFQPVRIGSSCSIRAPFHPAPPTGVLDLVIQPQMSFGTGHHATTALLVERLMSMQFNEKTVMDMGCGTAVLAILASIRGAMRVDAVDTDENAVRNARENCALNPGALVNVLRGDHCLAQPDTYDIFIANINRNVLLDALPTYVSSLSSKGIILMSGFFETDLPQLRKRGEDLGLEMVSAYHQAEWAMLEMRRK